VAGPRFHLPLFFLPLFLFLPRSCYLAFFFWDVLPSFFTSVWPFPVSRFSGIQIPCCLPSRPCLPEPPSLFSSEKFFFFFEIVDVSFLFFSRSRVLTVRINPLDWDPIFPAFLPGAGWTIDFSPLKTYLGKVGPHPEASRDLFLFEGSCVSSPFPPSVSCLPFLPLSIFRLSFIFLRGRFVWLLSYPVPPLAFCLFPFPLDAPGPGWFILTDAFKFTHSNGLPG